MQWQGLEKLYGQYGKELLLYLFSLSKNKALSEDLLQETFVKAYFSLSSRHTNVKAWLYTVARNLYFDHIKKEKPLIFSSEDQISDENSSPEEIFFENEEKNSLFNALNQLDARKKEVLTLQYFCRMTHKEIAEVLQIRSDYVRVLSLRGKKEIKKRMEEDGYELP